MRCIAVIPARYASTRLPGKPLLLINGKPLIQHVYERALQVQQLDAVIVATDDQRIARAVTSFGGLVRMTSTACASGSDRLLEIMSEEKAHIYINIQGDEVLLRPESVSALVQHMRENSEVQVATLCYPITVRQATNPHLVKVVCAENGNALYFSRAVIPYSRDEAHVQYMGHLGVYGYRAEALQYFGRLPPSPLENIEKLEQLRLLHAGIPICVLPTKAFGPGVDTLEDLEIVRRILNDPLAKVEKISNSYASTLRNIKLLITDVDGVLTDGGLYYNAEGECLKRFHARDGMGVRLLHEAGIQVAVLSGRDSLPLRTRMHELGISIFDVGQCYKGEACKKLMRQANVSPGETIFLGDDIQDIPAFCECALGVAVADAADTVKTSAHIVLKSCGGQGALRELADMCIEIKK